VGAVSAWDSVGDKEAGRVAETTSMVVAAEEVGAGRAGHAI
jgi:hypothetical protein